MGISLYHPFCQVLIMLSIKNTPNKRAALQNPRDCQAQTNPATPFGSRPSHHVTESTAHMKRSTIKQKRDETPHNKTNRALSCPISARDLTEHHQPCRLRATVLTCMLSSSVLYILAETHAIAYSTYKHKPTHKHASLKSTIHF